MFRRLLALALGLLAVGALGGCTEGKVDEANAYVAAVNEAKERFATASERLSAALTPDDPSGKQREVLAEYYAAADRFAERLRAIEPPTLVRLLHERLVAAVTRFGSRLREAGEEIASASASRTLDGQQRLADATAGLSRSINAAIDAINAALQG